MADKKSVPVEGAQIKSRKRVADHGEVFTNPREVNAMLDLVKHETENIESRFLEPACGTGNFLIEILHRKLSVCEQRVRSKQYTQLQYEQNAVLSVSSIYGIELLEDNAQTCRERLLNFFVEQYKSLFPKTIKEECIESVRFLLSKNIIQGDALTYHRTDNSNEWIVVSEWSMLGKGMINRRDYEFSYLVGENTQQDLFSDIPCATFKPVYFLNLREEAYA